MQLVIRVPIQPLVIDATVDADDNFVCVLTADASAQLPSGTWELVEVLTNTGTSERNSDRLGQLTVQPNPLVPDAPSWAQAALLAAEAAIMKIAQSPNATVSVNGQSYTKQNLDSLINLRNYLANIVATQRVADGTDKQNWKTIQTQFRYG